MLLIIGIVALCGCAAKKVIPAKVQTEVMLPWDCITEMHATEKTTCTGVDATHIRCENVQITRTAGCEKVEVKQPEKSKKQ